MRCVAPAQHQHYEAVVRAMVTRWFMRETAGEERKNNPERDDSKENLSAPCCWFPDEQLLKTRKVAN